MRKLINVHCHLLNLRFVPDAFFKTRGAVREWMLREKGTRLLARIFSWWPGIKYDRLHELLKILNMDINDVAEVLAREMENGNEAPNMEIVLSTPLMMDLEIASFNESPEIPYRCQVMLISDIAAAYPARIMPFIMFDPRRKAASDLVITALEKYGFLGIKMYPSLGYHPDPSSLLNDKETNKQLAKVYKYCSASEKLVPITTHCSRGGAYSSQLMGSREVVQLLSRPSNWEGVLRKHKELHLNFAHFGGQEGTGKDKRHLNTDAQSWCSTIQKMMGNYENVYADTSYHDDALYKKTSKRYFRDLNKLIDNGTTRDRIIFGTDWLMTRHTWKEREYAAAFMRSRGEMLDLIAFQNPLNFLFPARELPQRILDFYKSRNVDESALPVWIKDNLTNLNG